MPVVDFGRATFPNSRLKRRVPCLAAERLASPQEQIPECEASRNMRRSVRNFLSCAPVTRAAALWLRRWRAREVRRRGRRVIGGAPPAIRV